jgi:2-keto-3-deoxy-L-rhamnonate aldolase RhmA
MSSLHERLRHPPALVGTILTLASPDTADILSQAGFDYLWIDLEHSAMDVGAGLELIRAIGGRCPTVVRVAERSEAWIKKALDTGCEGIVLPQARSAEEVFEAVSWCRYPPQGRRGVGLARAHGYGAGFASYLANANDELAVIVQIEHIQAVEELDAILEAPGVSALLIGPADLSGSLGVLGQLRHPDVVEAIERVRSRCATAGMPLGIYAPDAPSARQALAEGFRMIAYGTDASLLLGAAHSALAGLG